MKRALLLALGAAAAAGCGGSSGTGTLGLSQPSSVAVFQGLTSKNVAIHPYVAVANSGKDELVLIDAVDDKPVLAPVLIEPMVIPVPDPRPAQVVSASLHDGTAEAPRADLLVALSAGSTRLQLVRTWDADTRVMPELEVDLRGDPGAPLYDPGAQVLAIAAAPVPVPKEGGGFTAAEGRARIVAALSGHRLAVVEYARQGDGSSIAPASAVATVQELALAGQGFGVVSLAVNPSDPAHLYAASPDPIPTGAGDVLGVAELDITGAPGAWTWRGLDARAPTLLVAAYRLAEGRPGSTADGPNFDKPELSAFQATEVDRVYAYLSTDSCGSGQRIACGIAVIDPVAGRIAADPSGYMPYMAPIALPAVPIAMVVADPPDVPPPSTQYGAPYLQIAPETGARLTTGVLAVPSGNGRVYFVDLARRAIPNNVSILRRATTRTALERMGTGAEDRVRLGFWDGSKLALDADAAAKAVTITPGFTQTESFTVGYQAPLPGLELRRGETGSTDDGRLRLSLQVRIADGAGGERATQVVRLYDPMLGVHVGDIVDIVTNGLDGCAKVTEAAVTELVAPDASRPGGSVVLGELPCGDANEDGVEDEDCPVLVEFRACRETLLAGRQSLAATVYAGGGTVDAPEFLVYGTQTGYAGRVPAASAPGGPEFRLEHRRGGLDEDQLAPLCPLVPWPSLERFTGSPETVACDATCRARCEDLILSRKARRIYHLSDSCSGSSTDTTVTNDCLAAFPGYPFPLADGPVIAFRVGIQRPEVNGVVDQSAPLVRFPTDNDLGEEIGTFASIGVRSGIEPSYRSTPDGAAGSPVLPLGVAAFDRSTWADKESEGYRFFVPYVDGHVLDFSPSEFFGSSKVIR
jgi:hypothetical protein